MAVSEILLNVVFYVFAAAAIAGALAVALSRNIVRSAFALLAVLFSAAALYALMKADFIAAAQVLIYVGGILVLIIFAIMLTHRITDVNVSNESTAGPAPFFACVCLLFSLVVVILSYPRWERGPEEVRARAGNVDVILTQYQSDGKTGLALGGSTLEERVFLSAAVPRPPAGAVEVQFEAMGKEGKKPIRESAKLEGGVARVDLKGLPEGPVRWRVRLLNAEGTAVTPDSGKAMDFTVYRGVTQPVALGFMGPYLFAFEVVSMLLLAALVGAAFLARKEVKEA